MIKRIEFITFNWKSVFHSFILSFCLILVSCGKVYFPIELKTISRTDRLEGQESNLVKIVPLTQKNIKKANLYPYKRVVISAGDLNKPSEVLSIK